MGTLNTGSLASATLRKHPFPKVSASAFTLIELLTVMAIMIVILGLSIAAFRDLGRGTGMRGAVLEFKSGMSQARQTAITRRIPNRIRFSNEDANQTATDYTDDRGYFCIEQELLPRTDPKKWVLQGVTNFFPEEIRFAVSTAVTNAFEFKVDGSCVTKLSTTNITIVESRGTNILQSTTLSLHRQTGRVKVLTGQP